MDNNNDSFVKPDAHISFPSQLDSFEVKKKQEWGLQLARQISNEWFYGLGVTNGCLNSRFNTQRQDFIERRIYAMGLESMEKYKPIFNPNGDKSYLNLSKKAISPLPKFIDVVVNGMADRGYSITATSIDPIGYSERIAYREKIENDKNAKDVIIKAKETFGIDIGSMPVDQLPETDDELKLHMQLEYKQDIELSTELAIEEVMAENRYNEMIDRMIKRDLAVLGTAWVKNEFIPDRGVVLKYVNPENKIQSYTESPYYDDCFYHGEFKTVPLSEIYTDFQWVNEPGNAKIKEQIANSGQSWWSYNLYSDADRIKGTASLLYFTYKTTRERSKKLINRPTGEKVVMEYSEGKNVTGNYEPFKRISLVEEVLMEGVLVLGTDILLKWEVCENMSRPKSDKQKVVEQYIGIAPNRERGYIDSLVARMITTQDQLNILQLKGEQLIQKIQPDGFIIDPDAIAELDFGNGTVMKVQNVIDMFWQTGSIFARSFGANGDPMYSKPITELKTGSSLEKLQAITVLKMQHIDQLRDLIGLNKFSDASTPDKDSLVGLQKAAALSTNIATRHILDGASDITKRTAEAILYRVADLLKYSDLKDDFARKIGATAVKTLDSIKELHLHDFAIFLSLELDAEEKAKLEMDMSKAIEKGQLSLQDKYKVMKIKNFDLAIAYLTILIEKFQAKQQKQKLEDIQANTQSQTQIVQASEEFKQKTLQMQGQMDAQLQQMVNDGLIQKENVKGVNDRETMKLKIQGDLAVAQTNGGVQMDKMNFLEDRKDERSVKEATQNSEMIEQRKKEGAAPIDFEAKEIDDSIFELSGQ